MSWYVMVEKCGESGVFIANIFEEGLLCPGFQDGFLFCGFRFVKFGSSGVLSFLLQVSLFRHEQQNHNMFIHKSSESAPLRLESLRKAQRHSE